MSRKGWASPQRYYWRLALPLFWCFALWLLWNVSPIFVDGGGAIGTLYWSTKPPLAASGDSTRTLSFLLPYFLSATVITLVCWSTKSLAQRPKGKRFASTIVSSAAICAAVLLLVALISDLGTRFHLWNGPLLILTPFLSRFVFRLLLPLSMAFALLTSVERRVAGHSVGKRDP